MASLGMSGPFPLTPDEIDRQVTRTSPGNYALGYSDTDGRFHVQYVGRDDVDVGERLHDHVGKSNEFKFDYASSPKAAFIKECENYHDFIKTTANKIHPARPSGANWQCPRCDRFRD